MRVSELAKGNLYHFLNQPLQLLRATHWDNGVQMESPCFALGRKYYGPAGSPALSKTLIYLRSEHVGDSHPLRGKSAQVYLYGCRKWHLFLMDGHKVYVSGYDIKYFRHV